MHKFSTLFLSLFFVLFLCGVALGQQGDGGNWGAMRPEEYDELLSEAEDYYKRGGYPLLNREGRGGYPLLNREGRAGGYPLLNREGRAGYPLLNRDGRAGSRSGSRGKSVLRVLGKK